MQYAWQDHRAGRAAASPGVQERVPLARSHVNEVLLGLICVAVVVALLAATFGAGASAGGLRELVSGPGLPSAARPAALSTAPVGRAELTRPAR